MRRWVVALLFAWPDFGQSAGDGTLSGKITDSLTHQPIAGAHLSYFGGVRSVSAVSDANGAYSFPVAARERESEGNLSIEKTGYAIANPSSSNGIRLHLKPGSSETRDFELSRYATLSGHLLDRDSGRPIAGFSVAAIRPDGRPGLPVGISPPTDATGSFVMANIRSGDYTLEIDPPTGGRIFFGDPKADEVGYGRNWFPGVPRVEMAVPITLTPGENREIEVRLRKRELRHIGGSLQVPQGREGDAIMIGIGTSMNNFIWTMASGNIPKAGPFHISGLGEGSYRLFAATVTNPAEDQVFVSRTLELTDKSMDDLRLTMQPGVALRAIVTMAEKDVETPSGIHFVPLPLFDGYGWGRLSDLSDGLRWSSLPPGEYWPMMEPPSGYAVASVIYGGRPVTNTSIDIEAPDSSVIFTLTSRPGRVAGVVRDADQSPVSDITVVLLPESLPDTYGKFLLPLRRTNPDGSGGFWLSDLTPGRYKAVALRGADRLREADLVFLRDRARSVNAIVVETGQTTNLDIHVPR